MGVSAVRSECPKNIGTLMTDLEIKEVKNQLQSADAVVIGAGSGLSTSAGFTYSGERFKKYFSDFSKKYGFCDMYSGGFTDFEGLEEYWAYWSRYIFINRYMKAPFLVYEELLNLVQNKDHFVITTNVDHSFQKAGFEKERLFYTQGDYGLFQCSKPCHKKTYDNEETVQKMLEAQGGKIIDGNLEPGNFPLMKIPLELVPKCPECERPVAMNLRCDNTFVEDEGWHKAAGRYENFLNKYKNKNVLFLELGVGGNTPGIIKYPFWNMTYANKNAKYICINKGDAVVPEEIKKQSICINDDIFTVLKKLR